MATLPLVAAPVIPPAEVPGDLAREHWRERLLRGYLAIKSLCLRFALPVEGHFFDGCVAGFARAYRLADKGTRTRKVDLLSAVIIYRQSLLACIPVSKSAIVEYLGGVKALGAFHRVLAATAKHAPRQDPRAVASRFVTAILDGVNAPGDVMEVASEVMATALDAFLVTKPRVCAATVVAAAVLAAGREKDVRLTQIAACAQVAPSAVDRCLTTTAARLGKPLPGVPSKCGETFKELFAAGNPCPPP